MPAPSVSNLVVSHPGATTPPSDANQWGDYPGNADERADKDARPSQIADKQVLFDVLKGWFRSDATHSTTWRVEAKEMYDFRAGEQWSPEDRQVLNAQSRPEIVFNRVLTILKAVAGMEINGRHEVHYIPRHNQDTAVNELLTGAGKWLTDECDAEDEESQAFDDCNTCGIGVTEHRLDYELDQKGRYIEERFDPLEYYWDRNAKRKNLVDARRMWRVKKMPLADAMQLFPGKSRHALDATWAVGTEMDATSKTLEEKRKREENTTDTTYDDMYEVTIVNAQWWEREQYWLVADPVKNQMMELTPEKYAQFSARSRMLNQTGQKINFMAVQMTRRVYKEAFLGGELLSLGDAGLKQFKWTVITGEFNRTRGQWFGLVKLMKDPQMWANKWLSQTLHILNTTAKGGIIAEEDAFKDIREAEDKWPRPDAIIWAKRGALSGDKPKVMPKPGQGMPQGVMELMQFAISAIRDVTGINLELLGLKDANQPGILEAQRKQAGMTVLATVFDSLRRFRKLGGRVRLHVIQNYLADGRLIRIVGPEGARAIPLMKDKTFGEYDVVVDDAPTSPNQKEANWLVISQMLPAFKDQLATNPELLVMVLEYSPLPSRLIEALKEKVQSMGPVQQQQQQIAVASAAAKMNKDQAQAELYLAQAGKQQSTAMYDIAIAMAQFMDAHNSADKNAAQAAHERVKAAVAALTPIPEPPNSSLERAHERHTQVKDHIHDANMQVGQQRFDLIKEAMAQQHERKMAAMGALNDAAQTVSGQQHEAGMQAADQQHEAQTQAADQQHEAQLTGAEFANQRMLAKMQPKTSGQGATESA